MNQWHAIRRACGWLMLVLVVGLALPASAGAQTPPITFQVSFGYENAYRVDEWFPVRIRVANSGQDVSGQIVFRFDNDSSQFARELELPQGAQKEVTLYATGSQYARTAQVQFVVNGTAIASQNITVEAIDTTELLAGVVSSDPALLNSLESATPLLFTGATVRHLGLADIPEQAQALGTLQVLFLHDLDTSTLSNGQRAALSSWVHAGGLLVVSGGTSAAANAALADLLPVTLSNALVNGPLTALGEAVAGEDAPAVTAALSQNVAKPLAEELFDQGGQPLVVRQRLGSGQVVFTAFDLAALRGWPGESLFWQEMLNTGRSMSFGAVARYTTNNLLTSTLLLPELTLLPVWLLLLLLVLYVVVLGPVNYLVLKRFQRLEWAWATIPISVAVFVIGIYTAGRLARGTETLVFQISVAQTAEGDTQATMTSFTGLFSPNRARYTFGFGPDTVASEMSSFSDFDSGGGQNVTTDTGTEVRDSLVDIGAVRTVLSEYNTGISTTVASQLQTSGSTISGNILYSGSVVLEDAFVLHNRATQQLGTLNSGDAADVSLDTTDDAFPWSLSLSPVDSFDRQNLLSQISSMNSSGQSLFADGETYLVGWQSAPATPVQINGAAAQPEALTLYVVRLNQR